MSSSLALDDPILVKRRVRLLVKGQGLCFGSEQKDSDTIRSKIWLLGIFFF